MSKRLLIVGATASSKSQVAIDFALENKPTEIISLDSMQIYEGMSIGTGALNTKEMNGIIHHMISIVRPTETFSVQVFKNKVDEIITTNKEMNFVLVGGTGLYTHAVVDDFNFAPSEQKVRDEIALKFNLDEKNPDPISLGKAYEYLQEIDNDAAEKIDPKNVRRILRAIEAIEISGEKFSYIGDGVQAFSNNVYDLTMVGLRYSRENLRTRIFKRIENMFDLGWVDEVKTLLPLWDDISPIAKQAIGYKEIYGWIVQGENQSELINVKESILNKTYQFSVRQRKWFERDPRITWIDCDDLQHHEILDKVSNIALW
ncbi:MAG: tRNA (adenosine(37)-N6)-dimethylallyltransferase MiaA [Acidimicrobiia bacterium]